MFKVFKNIFGKKQIQPPTPPTPTTKPKPKIKQIKHELLCKFDLKSDK